MAYTIHPGEDVAAEIRSIAHDQVATAIDDLSDPGDDLIAAIHDARKRCKKLRGLVRLARPALGDDYQVANTTFRDAARHLAPLRDAHAVLATFETLCDAHRDQLPESGLTGVHDELRRRSDQASRRAATEDPAVASALVLLRSGQGAIDDWEIHGDGIDVLAGGLGKTYRRGRTALDTARRSPTGEHFHEYRKRVKYTWYHVRLLRELAPGITAPLRELLHDLSDSLGDEHDLVVLSERLRADADAYGGDAEVAAAMVLVDGRRADLQRRALSVGSRIHAEKPKAFVRRFVAYWEAWHEFGPELDAGEIGELEPG